MTTNDATISPIGMARTIRAAAIGLMLIAFCLECSKPVDVADLKLDVAPGDTETVYYRFAPGDVIILDVAPWPEGNYGEVVVRQWPHSPRFSASTRDPITNVRLTVTEASIYSFEFPNGLLSSSRTYSIKIRRVPRGENARLFTTAVPCQVRYDTLWVTRSESTLVTDTLPLRSTTTAFPLGHFLLLGSMCRTVPVTLPDGTDFWTYWIGPAESKRQARGPGPTLDDIYNAVVDGAMNAVSPWLAVVNAMDRLGAAASDYFVTADSENLKLVESRKKAVTIDEQLERVFASNTITHPTEGTVYVTVLTTGIYRENTFSLYVVPFSIEHHFAVTSMKTPIVRGHLVPIG